ncbi:MAG: mechanosensitive ion channel family protein [Bacteriovoracaceae bacterium]|nr:mechanosensitive ion channel family protein [Bacteriovoracaceae bacterium]
MDKIISDMLRFWLKNPELIKFVETLLVILILNLTRIFSVKLFMHLKGKSLTLERRQRIIIQSRLIFILLSISTVFIIWGSEIKSVALSIAAVAAAIAIATKELFLCIAGSFWRISSRPFSLGDRIEIEDIRGDVIDMGLFATVVLEVGPKNLTHQFTGRAITIPNSVFLTKPVINETFSTEYVLHVIVVPLSINDNWQLAEKCLLEAANMACGEHIEKARRHMTRITNRQNVPTPTIEPNISVKVPEVDKINLVLRITIPAYNRSRTEQAIIRQFLTTYKK